jgi:prepilin-type N-terminal cleavage/methylation domain-containing protein
VPKHGEGRSRITRHSPLATRHPHAFTLVELLVVIGIIAALAGMIFPVVGAVKKRQYINHAQAEMAQLETAIDRYKATYGFYPPDNQDPANDITYRFRINQLYYELTGTAISDENNPNYQSLNNPSLPTLTGGAGGNVQTFFGVGGFMNCSKPAGGEESAAARNFLPELRPNQVWNNYTNLTITVGVTLLNGSVGGPDPSYQPLGLQDLNPWRYNSSNPTNNPGSYDLWIQLSIGRKTHLICNWTKQVQVDSPLP